MHRVTQLVVKHSNAGQGWRGVGRRLQVLVHLSFP